MLRYFTHRGQYNHGSFWSFEIWRSALDGWRIIPTPQWKANSLKRSLKVTITKVSRREVISANLETYHAHCKSCGCEVATLSKAQALKVTGLEAETIDELAAAGEIHAIGAANDRICRDSLFRKVW